MPLNYLAEDTKLRAFETVVMASRDITAVASNSPRFGDQQLAFRRGQYVVLLPTMVEWWLASVTKSRA